MTSPFGSLIGAITGTATKAAVGQRQGQQAAQQNQTQDFETAVKLLRQQQMDQQAAKSREVQDAYHQAQTKALETRATGPAEPPYIPENALVKNPEFGKVPGAPQYIRAGGEKKEDTTSEPLESVVGPDGKPTLVPRSKAAGMRPYQRESGGGPEPMVQVQGDDGSPIWVPRSQAAGRKAPTRASGAPSETERRGAALLKGGEAALADVEKLIKAGYDPLKENKASQAAATVGMGRTATGLASPQGKLYRNAVLRLTTNYLYTVSGATANPGEIVSQAEQMTTGILDNPDTLEQKLDFMRGKVDEMRSVAGRAAPQGGRGGGAGGGAKPQKPAGASDEEWAAYLKARGITP